MFPYRDSNRFIATMTLVKIRKMRFLMKVVLILLLFSLSLSCLSPKSLSLPFPVMVMAQSDGYGCVLGQTWSSYFDLCLSCSANAFSYLDDVMGTYIHTYIHTYIQTDTPIYTYTH